MGAGGGKGEGILLSQYRTASVAKARASYWHSTELQDLKILVLEGRLGLLKLLAFSLVVIDRYILMESVIVSIMTKTRSQTKRQTSYVSKGKRKQYIPKKCIYPTVSDCTQLYKNAENEVGGSNINVADSKFILKGLKLLDDNQGKDGRRAPPKWAVNKLNLKEQLIKIGSPSFDWKSLLKYFIKPELLKKKWLPWK